MSVVVASGVFAVGTSRVVLGFDPDAILLWWTRQTEPGIFAGNSGGVAFWASGEARAAAWESADGVNESRASRAADEIAVLGLHDDLVEVRGRVRPSGDGFAVEWEGTGPWTIHYLALAGLAHARVGWVTDKVEVGFAPDLILVSPISVAALGSVERDLAAGLGAAASSGQFGTAFRSRDGALSSDVAGAQLRDAALVVVASREELGARGRVTLGDRGFTVAWSPNESVPRLHAYLAIAGVRCRVGTATSPRRSGRRRTRHLGFRPKALLVFTWGLSARSGPTDIGRLCVGAATETSMGCAGWDDRDIDLRPTMTHVCSSTDDLVLVTNTQSGAVHASAAVTSLDRRGFTLEWRKSDGHEREIVYVAVA